MSRLLTTGVWLVYLSVTVAAVADEAVADEAGFDRDVRPFFQTYCLRCHDGKQQEGEFRLDTLVRDFENEETAQRWGEVIFRMNAGEMPPKKQPQPKPGELGIVVEWLSARVTEGRAARMAKRGPVTHYRLSRDEYANTVYDLLGVRYDVYQPGAMNEDPRWHGFARIGSMLSLSPSHVDRYLRAGEVSLQRAFPDKTVESRVHRRPAIDMRFWGSQKKIEEKMGIAPERVRALLFPGYEGVGGLRNYWDSHIRNYGGVYRARVQLSGLTSLDGITPHLTVWDPKLKKSVFDEDIIAPEDKPIVIEFETFLQPNASLILHNEVSGKIPDGHHANVLSGGGGVFTSTKEVADQLNPTGYQLTTDDGRAVYPLLIVDWVEWEGPITTELERANREGLVPEFKSSETPQAERLRHVAASREALERFARRAWRRPVTAEEVDRYVRVFQREVEADQTPRTAHLAAMLGILTSQNFYYIVEGGEGRGRELNDFELATRLSYFLWSSMPDDALLAAATADTLSEPEELRTQLSRMLADPKIERFTETFPKQWLQLHRVGMFPPDSKLYPDYDLWLEKSMVLETTEFFHEVFAQNMSISEFLDSDWTMLNPRLARHYELPQLPKSGFQRVALQSRDHRGGLLTHGSVLSLTSDGTRHRPVHRGVWVSEAIFGKTPPPPPPNVEPLEPTPADQPKATIRKQIEAHATNATCASCHQRIDPYGFAFENFDAIGRWRSEQMIIKGKGDNRAVDASGVLPDGRKFRDVEEFKERLIEKPEPFARAFVESLATFALRRTMTVDDREQIAAITSASAESGYRLRDLIERLVISELFRMR